MQIDDAVTAVWHLCHNTIHHLSMHQKNGISLISGWKYVVDLVEGDNQLIWKAQEHLRKTIGETAIICDIKLWIFITKSILKNSTHKIQGVHWVITLLWNLSTVWICYCSYVGMMDNAPSHVPLLG